MFMVFEGTHSETLEDAFGILPTTDADENPVPAADEAFYCTSILSGEYDEYEADREGFYTTDEQYSASDLDYFADREADRWERNFWGD